MPKFVLFLFLIFISYNLKAQTWEFGGGIGAAGYMGDLNINNPVKVSGPSVGIFGKYNFDGYFALKIGYNFGIISGADSSSNNPQFRQRNLSFTTSLFEASIIGEFNFMKYIPSVSNNKYTPYIFLGVAAANYYPSTIYQGKKYNLRGLVTEDEKKPYPTTTLSIPYGAGIKYNFTSSLTLGAEIGYRNTNTDYLDDVSGNYANKNTASQIANALADRSGEKTGIYIGTPGTQRGDLNPHDTYFFTQVTISFTFISQKCYFQ